MSRLNSHREEYIKGKGPTNRSTRLRLALFTGDLSANSTVNRLHPRKPHREASFQNEDVAELRLPAGVGRVG